MSQNIFLDMKPSKLFLRAAIPGGISMLASSLYGVFESAFIGKFLGTTAFAAFGMAFPVVVMNFALAELVGVGSSVPISIFLGQKEEKKANNYFTCAILLTIITGILSGLLIYFGSPWLMSLMGAKGELLDMAVRYLRVYAVCSPIAPLMFSLDNYLRICGRTKTSMTLNIVFSVVTIGLEFVLIRVLQLGIIGAALGSCIAMISCVLFGIMMFVPGKLQLKYVRPHFSKEMFIKIYQNGVAPFLTNISGRLFSILMNVMLLREGGARAVAIYAVVMTLAGIVEQSLYGVIDSLQPSIGYNYGAKRFDRVKKIEIYVFITAALISIFGGIVMFTVPKLIAAPFLEDLSLMNMAIVAIRITSCAYLIKWISTGVQCFFMAIERPLQAMCISVASACGFPLLFIIILLPLGLDGLWLNYPMATLFTVILTFLILFLNKKVLGEFSKTKKVK